MDRLNLMPLIEGTVTDWRDLIENGNIKFILDNVALDKSAAAKLPHGQDLPDVIFSECTFHNGFQVHGITFLDGVEFQNCDFGDAPFYDCTFNGPVTFKKTIGGSFTSCQFDSEVIARRCAASKETSLYDCALHRNVYLTESRFSLPLVLDESTFHSRLNLARSIFLSDLHMNHAQFLSGPPNTAYTTFPDNVGLVSTRVYAERALQPQHENETRRNLATLVSDDARRLQQLAQKGNNHSLELDCHTIRLRCSEIIDGPFNLKTWPSRLYGAVSDYGRSVARPVAILFALWGGCAPIYELGTSKTIGAAVSLGISAASLSNVFGMRAAFFPEWYTHEFVQSWILPMSAGQSIAGVLLVFLIGLALRNRFKID